MGIIRDVRVRLSVDNAQAVAGLKQTGAAADQVAGRMQRAGINSGKALDTIGRGSRNVAIAGGVALAAIAKANINFDKQMSSVDAATHETARNMELLRQSAIKAGADTQFSATEAAAGITELAKAGVRTRQILGGGLKGALDLAAAGQLSVAEAAEISANAMTQFQLKGSQVPHIADLLAAGAGKAQGSVHDLGMALNQSGLIASQTGLSIEDTTGALAAFAKAGLTGSDAGTSFKTMLMSLNPRSAEAAKLMKRYGIEAYDAQGNFVGLTEYAGKLRKGLEDLTSEQRARALQKIFGTDAIRAANILYRNGAKGIQGWIRQVDEAGYAADTARRQTDNLAGDWERFTGSLESSFLKGGGGFQKQLRQMLQGAEGLVDKFNELPKSVQEGTVKALAGLTGLAAGVWGLSKAMKAVQTIRGGFGGSAVGGVLGAAGGGVTPVFVTNPGFAGAGGIPGKGGTPPVVGAAAGGGKLAALGKVTLAAGAVYLAGSLAEPLVQKLQTIGSPGKDPRPQFDKFDLPKDKSPKLNVEEFLFGEGHTIKTDITKALEAVQGPGKIRAETSGFLSGLLGQKGDIGTAIANVEDLDSAMSKIKAPDRQMAQFKNVMEETGYSAEQLNRVLPKTAEAMAMRDFKGSDWAPKFIDGIAGVVNKTQQYKRVLDTVPKRIRSFVSTPGAVDSFSMMRRIQKQYNLTPKQIRTIMRVQGFNEAQIRAFQAGAAFRRLPKEVRTKLQADNGPKTMGEVLALINRYKLTPKQIKTVMRVSGVEAAQAAARKVQSTLGNIRDETVYIHVKRLGSAGVGLHKAAADGWTVPKRGGRYGDYFPAMVADGEEVISNRHGEADQFRRDRAAGRIPAYADGGTAGLSAVSGGRGTTSVSVTFPTPVVLKAAVDAANQIAVDAAFTARSARETRAANLADLQTRKRILDLQRDLARKETVTVKGKDGKDDNKSKKGLQDTKKKIRRLAVRGLDRTIAQAELADARAQLLEDRAALADEARKAITEARTEARQSLIDNTDIFARGFSPTSVNNQVTRLTVDLAQYGQVIARLRSAKAAPGLLAKVKALGDSGDFRSAIRFGQAVLDQPAVLAQLNTSFGQLDQVAGGIAGLTTDPRFLGAGAWNPTGQVASTQVVQLQLGVDPSTWMTELVNRATANVMQAMNGGRG